MACDTITVLCAKLGFCHHEINPGKFQKDIKVMPKCRLCGKPSARQFIDAVLAFNNGYKSSSGIPSFLFRYSDKDIFQEMVNAFLESKGYLIDMYWPSTTLFALNEGPHSIW